MHRYDAGVEREEGEAVRTRVRAFPGSGRGGPAGEILRAFLGKADVHSVMAGLEALLVERADVLARSADTRGTSGCVASNVCDSNTRMASTHRLEAVLRRPVVVECARQKQNPKHLQPLSRYVLIRIS